MIFNFILHLTDEDYIKFNEFVYKYMPFGKKQITTFRFSFLFTAIAIALLVLQISNNLFFKTVFCSVMLILGALGFIFARKFFLSAIKSEFKRRKKTERLYAPDSSLEFYGEDFIERTPDQILTQKYSSVNSVSVLKDKTIYIHISTAITFIIPSSAFENQEHFDKFVEFLKTKVNELNFF